MDALQRVRNNRHYRRRSYTHIQLVKFVEGGVLLALFIILHKGVITHDEFTWNSPVQHTVLHD